jgi:flagellar hook-length control protein FliK
MKFSNINLRKKFLSLVVGICVVGTVSAAGIAINVASKPNQSNHTSTASTSTITIKGENQLATLDTITDSTSSDVSSSSAPISSSSSPTSSSNNNSESTTSLGNGIIQQNNVQQNLPDPNYSSPNGNAYPDAKAGN